MRKLRRLWMQLRGIKGGQHADRDLADELDSILHMHIDDNLRGGITPDQARRQALIRLVFVIKLWRRSCITVQGEWQHFHDTERRYSP